MTFDQHQLWRWSHREWTVSSSFSVIPLMVIASSWYNLSFASPGDDRIGAQALIRDTRTTDQWSCSEKILSPPSADEAMDPSRVFLTVKPTPYMFPGLIWWFPLPEKRGNFFPWHILNLTASSLEKRRRPFTVCLVPYRWFLSYEHDVSFPQVFRKAWY